MNLGVTFSVTVVTRVCDQTYPSQLVADPRPSALDRTKSKTTSGECFGIVLDSSFPYHLTSKRSNILAEYSGKCQMLGNVLICHNRIELNEKWIINVSLSL